ncbi:carbohydrate kinase [Candidatus Gottesmanbacteria bacterium RBG_13_45_10]|uniref:Carbohydrate kinase n=1 Tax=Candidatus Gottesmanbacteria bacterium RBG_13_45_10 TaxID=1798370 RepID=A0A1F5ZGX1_9BACT|nr:MAG: carbohydrate kinase [Candidatus Gottesmanbacteria bacterium RBG_13_45_10]
MSSGGYLLGYDLGSSFIKASLIDIGTGELVANAASTDRELTIDSPKPGWAQQHPDMWWKHIVQATLKIKIKVGNKLKDVKAIGITYQMHGLVLVDKHMNVLYPSIIWCDSRAVELGNKAFQKIGEKKCLAHLLNSPGNFTASKLAWVKQNLPEVYDKVYKMMLPGDYIAYKLTGEIKTTVTGLSEGILWDYRKQDVADLVLDYYGIPKALIPDIVPVFSIQGRLTKEAAEMTGLPVGVPVSYRAGDQPNNALSLNVLHPGEIAATTGTSGVVYGVGDKPVSDKKSRVNVFVHVNHTKKAPRYGTLLCLNGAGILNAWSKNTLFTLSKEGLSYDDMNQLAEKAPIGSEGLSILPFGNGAERTLENKNIGASIYGLNLTTHGRSHIARAVQEGVVFAMNYGLQIMGDMGLSIKVIKTGYANMFLSPLFASAFSTLTNSVIQLYNTDGSQGAARGAGIGAGIYPSAREAFKHLKIIKTVKPNSSQRGAYQAAYKRWERCLKKCLI